MARTVVIGAVLTLTGASPCAADWIKSAYAGAVHTRPANIHIEHPRTRTELVFPDVTFRSESLSPIYYGYRVGHSVAGRPWLFIEGELIHGTCAIGHVSQAGELCRRPRIEIDDGAADVATRSHHVALGLAVTF